MGEPGKAPELAQHCYHSYHSYLAEMQRRQMPDAYRRGMEVSENPENYDITSGWPASIEDTP